MGGYHSKETETNDGALMERKNLDQTYAEKGRGHRLGGVIVHAFHLSVIDLR